MINAWTVSNGQPKSSFQMGERAFPLACDGQIEEPIVDLLGASKAECILSFQQLQQVMRDKPDLLATTRGDIATSLESERAKGFPQGQFGETSVDLGTSQPYRAVQDDDGTICMLGGGIDWDGQQEIRFKPDQSVEIITRPYDGIRSAHPDIPLADRVERPWNGFVITQFTPGGTRCPGIEGFEHRMVAQWNGGDKSLTCLSESVDRAGDVRQPFVGFETT